MIATDIPIILASGSPRRAQLLRQVGIQFTAVDSGWEESINTSVSPEENVRTLSLHKANAVASRFRTGIVIGADTIVVLNGSILRKPATDHEAIAMLSDLSGKTHRVYSGFALVDARAKKNYIDHEVTEVTFRKLDEKEIREYVQTGSPMDKAGAYGIQDDFGAVFVERIHGCYYTVMGLPLSKLYVALRNFIQPSPATF